MAERTKKSHKKKSRTIFSTVLHFLNVLHLIFFARWVAFPSVLSTLSVHLP